MVVCPAEYIISTNEIMVILYVSSLIFEILLSLRFFKGYKKVKVIPIVVAASFLSALLFYTWAFLNTNDLLRPTSLLWVSISALSVFLRAFLYSLSFKQNFFHSLKVACVLCLLPLLLSIGFLVFIMRFLEDHEAIKRCLDSLNRQPAVNF